jgi:hypothetical protein
MPDLPPMAYVKTAETQFRQFWRYTTWPLSEKFIPGSALPNANKIIGHKNGNH